MIAQPSSNSSSDSFTASAREVCVPAAVVLQRKLDASSKWALAHWSVFAITAGAHLQAQGAQSVLIHDDGVYRRYWSGGLAVHLTTDGLEGYWYNLLSEPPHLFVICDGDHGDELVEPAFLTANQDEANGYMEADRLVLAAPMPTPIREVVERYVLTHYRPAQKKKRARREWIEESEYAKRGVDVRDG